MSSLQVMLQVCTALHVTGVGLQTHTGAIIIIIIIIIIALKDAIRDFDKVFSGLRGIP